ncbi:MAG: hypothetical protein ACI8RZ_001825 [Myxococcota bacterium]|jgi:hypothetical protein
MSVVVRILTALFALIALGTGGAGLLGGLGDAEVLPILDNNYRFFAGVWFTVGIGLAHCALKLEESTHLFRLLMLAIFIGGIGRAVGMLDVVPERRMIVGTLIETVLPALLILLQSRLLKKTT